MGVHHTVAVGYYFDIPPIISTKKGTRRACESCNKTHDKNKDNFCGACGGQIAIVEKNTNRKMDTIWEFLEGHPSLKRYEEIDLCFTPAYRISDSFHSINYGTIAENFNQNEDAWVIDIDSFKKLPMLDSTKNMVDPFMEEFKKIYGENSITLKYGIFAYAN
jgi:hypothetical protein